MDHTIAVTHTAPPDRDPKVELMTIEADAEAVVLTLEDGQRIVANRHELDAALDEAA